MHTTVQSLTGKMNVHLCTQPVVFVDLQVAHVAVDARRREGDQNWIHEVDIDRVALSRVLQPAVVLILPPLLRVTDGDAG